MATAESIWHEGRELLLVVESELTNVVECIYADEIYTAVLTLNYDAGTTLFVVTENDGE